MAAEGIGTYLMVTGCALMLMMAIKRAPYCSSGRSTLDRHCVRPAVMSSESRAMHRSHSSSSLSGLSGFIGTRRTRPLAFRRRRRWQILSIIRRTVPWCDFTNHRRAGAGER